MMYNWIVNWKLDYALRCTICMQRLDMSNKILPCQHTFCKECLKKIVSTHRELRCPECRVLVDVKVDDLPPNMLLAGILVKMSKGMSLCSSGDRPQWLFDNGFKWVPPKQSTSDLLSIINSKPKDTKQTDSREARKLSIERCFLSLVHACQCRDANCRLPGCKKMTRVLMHLKYCRRKPNVPICCPICNLLIALCSHHAKHCQGTKCLVPFCTKQKIKRQKLQQLLQRTQLLRKE